METSVSICGALCKIVGLWRGGGKVERRKYFLQFAPKYSSYNERTCIYVGVCVTVGA